MRDQFGHIRTLECIALRYWNRNRPVIPKTARAKSCQSVAYVALAGRDPATIVITKSKVIINVRDRRSSNLTSMNL